MKYQILDHKADLKIRFFGRDKKDLFSNAMAGMQFSQKPKIEKGNSLLKRKIYAKSLDLESLLVDFLSEINYLNDVNCEVYNRLKFIKFADNEIKAEIIGKKVKGFGCVIKGVTYHGLEIRQRKNGVWEATVVFDI